MPTKLFANGNPGKPKGTLNRTSSLVKEAIVKFLEDNIDQVQDSFDKLKPREKLDFIAEVLPYAAPKLKYIENEHSGEVQQEIKITWETPDVSWNELQAGKNKSSVGNGKGH